MKKLFCILSCIGIVFIFNSCEKETEIDASLLPGKWKAGTYYEVYNANNTGYFWDENDDMSEDEGKKTQTFTWTLEKSDLTQIHDMQVGQTKVPVQYTVTELTSTTLKYKDSYSFTRVN
jgi:hypothetical protein